MAVYTCESESGCVYEFHAVTCNACGDVLCSDLNLSENFGDICDSCYEKGNY